MADPVHSVSEMARWFGHLEVRVLRAAVIRTDPRDRAAYRSALNAIRDKVSDLKRGAALTGASRSGKTDA